MGHFWLSFWPASHAACDLDALCFHEGEFYWLNIISYVHLIGKQASLLRSMACPFVLLVNWTLWPQCMVKQLESLGITLRVLPSTDQICRVCQGAGTLLPKNKKKLKNKKGRRDQVESLPNHLLQPAKNNRRAACFSHILPLLWDMSYTQDASKKMRVELIQLLQATQRIPRQLDPL